MPKTSDDDLLSCTEAAAALFNRITPQMVSKRMRAGTLPVHYKPGKPGRVFCKRGELMKLYEEQLYG